MSAALATYPSMTETAASVSLQEHERVCAQRDAALSMLSATHALLRDPRLTYKQRIVRCNTAIALQAQRDPSTPEAPIRVDTGRLAKFAGFIPPTPDGDKEAGKRAHAAGRKLGGEGLKDFANLDAFDVYNHHPVHGPSGEIVSSSIVVSTRHSLVKLLQIARGPGGSRTPQRPRGRNVNIDPHCPSCGSPNTSLDCLACGVSSHTLDIIAKEGDPVTGFQRLETLDTKDTVVGGSTGFHSLETGDNGHDPLAELRPLPQWAPYKMEMRDGKATKVPKDPRNGRNGSSTDPTKWATYEQAEAASEKYHLDGVGFMFTDQDPYLVLDLDKCRDPETGGI